jgi:hypothetical protein
VTAVVDADVESLVQRFVSVWNETDPAARRAGIEALWTPDGRHLMGAQDARGYDALEARVTASHERSVVQGGNRFGQATAIQMLPGLVKFRWDMARRSGGAVVAAGVGFIERHEDGRILTDYLFTEV